MAGINTGPRARGRTIAGRLGQNGAWLLILLLTAVLALGLGLSVVGDDPGAAAVPPPQADGPNNALVQAPSPTMTQIPATPTATIAEAQTPAPALTQTHIPTPAQVAENLVAKPAESESSQTEELELETLKIPAPIVPEATPLPEPTPHETYSWTLQVPILMYHYISDPPEGADKYRQDLSTSPAAFREQMLWLADNGYETVDLYDLSLAIVSKVELPEKPIILTFDDGYRDNYENAFPLLRELGMTGTFFVTTEFIDAQNPSYLSWAMVQEMAAAGMRIEPHSKTHPDLTLHDRDFIIWEVLGSQETIASHTGHRPRYFAYPGGRYNSEVLGIVAELDFWGAVTTANGQWHGYNDRFEWGRVRMRNTTTLPEFIDMIQ